MSHFPQLSNREFAEAQHLPTSIKGKLAPSKADVPSKPEISLIFCLTRTHRKKYSVIWWEQRARVQVPGSGISPGASELAKSQQSCFQERQPFWAAAPTLALNPIPNQFAKIKFLKP
jgi:hypothetical protein